MRSVTIALAPAGQRRKAWPGADLLCVHRATRPHRRGLGLIWRPFRAVAFADVMSARAFVSLRVWRERVAGAGTVDAAGTGRSATYAIRGSRGISRRAWRRSGARTLDGSSAMAGSAAAAIACRAARCPRKAVRPGLVSVTCRRERESARTRETSTYPAPASADRCLLRTESEISRLSRMSENGNHRTGESIAHICRRRGAWISSSNAASLTGATPEMHDADRKSSRRTGRRQRSQSRLHQAPSSQGPNCRGWRADGGRSRRQQAPRQR